MEALVNVERAHDVVARTLRDEILRGVYAPGQRLPVERELATRFAVTRSAIRQALLILDQQGLVRVRSGIGGGPFVAHETLSPAVAAFENLLMVDPASADEFARAKLVLEPAVSAMAADSLTDAQLRMLEENIEASRALISQGKPATRLLVEFHSLLINSTGNRFLGVLVELLGRTLDRLPSADLWEARSPLQILAEHEELVEAVRRRDPREVRRLTAAHIAGIWEDRLAPVETAPKTAKTTKITTPKTTSPKTEAAKTMVANTTIAKAAADRRRAGVPSDSQPRTTS